MKSGTYVCGVCCQNVVSNKYRLSEPDDFTTKSIHKYENINGDIINVVGKGDISKILDYVLPIKRSSPHRIFVLPIEMDTGGTPSKESHNIEIEKS